MKKIRLCVAQEEWDEHAVKGVCPPLGIGYIGSVLDKAGYDVRIIDGHVSGYNAEKLAEVVDKESPDFVGFTATTYNRYQAIAAIRAVKKRMNVPVIVGGCHFSVTAKDALEQIPEIDYVVLSEGEDTVLELINKLADGESVKDVPGIAYRDGDKIVLNPNRDWVKDLSKDIPAINWDLYELDKYQHSLEVFEAPGRSIGLVSSRGCPEACAFCAAQEFWKRFMRYRDPIEFVDEIQLLHEKYGFNNFDFYDQNITLNKKKHLHIICDEIKKRGLKIKWYARSRVDTILKEDMEMMKDAGCVAIGYGVESGSPKVLKAIHKRATPEKAYETIKMTLDLGLHVKAFFMFSLPEEEKEDVDMTIKLMKKVQALGSKDNLMTPYGFTIIFPGTEVETRAKEYGTLAEDFSWNQPMKIEERNVRSENLTIVPFEQKTFPVEKIRLQVMKGLNTKGSLVKTAFREFFKIRSLKDARRFVKDANNFILNRVKN